MCLFICLTSRSVRRQTWVLTPDGTRLEQNAQARLKSLYKHAGQLVYGYVKREKQTWRYEMKEKKTMATPNKSFQTNVLWIEDLSSYSKNVDRVQPWLICGLTSAVCLELKLNTCTLLTVKWLGWFPKNENFYESWLNNKHFPLINSWKYKFNFSLEITQNVILFQTHPVCHNLPG